jgi:primosomal protein N' (replication factor Y)
LGTRQVTGCVVRTNVDVPDGVETRDLIRVIDRDAYVPPHVVDLAVWVAEYYAAGPGEALSAAMPPGAAQHAPHRAHAFRTIRVAALTAAGLDAAQNQPGAAARLTDRHREVLDILQGAPAGLPVSQLNRRGIGSDMLRRLVTRGLVSLRQERVERDPFASMDVVAATGQAALETRVLTDEQSAALAELERLAATRAFQVALLHGVTGSGKTEIYLRLADAVVAARRRVLVMVPEIALTPAVARAFRQTFGTRVAIQHSGLSAGERHDQWHRINDGEVDIVVGTRSAVFAPLGDVGLIIVDEEHDPSYKQEETPRYNGRDVAIVRGRDAGALVVLGSATPSMESYRNALDGRYSMVRLTKRIENRPLAQVAVVNMREEMAETGEDTVLSRRLAAALEARLGRGEQALLLLNRRGFASSVFCRECGETLDCPNCSVSLTLHHARSGPGRARCHYCNYSMTVPKTCAKCAGPYLEHVGFGTERVESDVRKLFPAVRLARVDRDTIQRRGAIERVLARFRSGELDVIIGTQMIAKGHDFPAVTLVGVISADVGLGIPDFRASERTFQLLTQVAGRAGRGTRPGEALIQTLFPEHYSIELACTQDYEAFYGREIVYRRAMRYPPALALVNAIVRGRTFQHAMTAATDLASRLSAAAKDGDFRVLGPAPAPLGKLRGEYRVQILVKGSHRPSMRQALLETIAASPDLARRVTVDVDPVSMM